MKRLTPNNITKLEPGQIFVFGSNHGGRHGKGAAKTAMKWGAKYGQGSGLQGNTYGIPTKTLSVVEIKRYVENFIEFANDNSHLTFLVTEIGCGLAGYKPKDIAPLFEIDNIHLPEKFWRILNK